MHAHENCILFSCVWTKQKHNQLSNHASNDMLHLYDDESVQSEQPTAPIDRTNKATENVHIFSAEKPFRICIVAARLQLLLLFYVIVVVFWFLFFVGSCIFRLFAVFEWRNHLDYIELTLTHRTISSRNSASLSLSRPLSRSLCVSRSAEYFASRRLDHSMCVL